MSQRATRLIRIGVHGLIWSAILIPAFLEIHRGFVPWFDGAVIAARSHQELAGTPLLIGQYSVASTTGQILFSPGPMEYELLAIPTALWPLSGPIIGAAAIAAALCSLVVEAGRSVLGTRGTVLGGLLAVGLLATIPEAVSYTMWNPYLGSFALFGALATAIPLALGRIRWAVPTVASASLAAQCHTALLPPAFLVVVVASFLGLMATRQQARLAIVIAVTTILCWAPPLLDLAGGHRNLIHLATAGSSGEVFGPAFGLRVVSSALWGVPLIVVRYSASRFPFTSETPWVGGAFGIVLLLGLGALCRWRKASGPAAAAWIVASAAIGEAISFAMVLKIRFLVVGYLDVMLWPLSAAAFAVTVWCVSALVRSAPWAKSLRIPKRFPAGVATAGLVGCVLCGIIAVERITTTQPGGPGALEAGRASIAIATQIEKTVPLGPVNLEVTGPTGSTLGLGDAQTIAYRLRVDGWSPGLPDFAARSLGPTYEWKPGSPLAHVTVSPLANHTSVSISR